MRSCCSTLASSLPDEPRDTPPGYTKVTRRLELGLVLGCVHSPPFFVRALSGRRPIHRLWVPSSGRFISSCRVRTTGSAVHGGNMEDSGAHSTPQSVVQQSPLGMRGEKMTVGGSGGGNGPLLLYTGYSSVQTPTTSSRAGGGQGRSHSAPPLSSPWPFCDQHAWLSAGAFPGNASSPSSA